MRRLASLPLRIALFFSLFALVQPCGLSQAAEPETIRVLTYNLWHGGDAGNQPLERTIEVIKKSHADIVGLQETGGNSIANGPRPDRAAEIAKALDWHYLNQGARTGIISRFPITGNTPTLWGVQLQMPSGRKLYHFNVHLMHAPYQPYQLLGIPYNNGKFLKTAEEAIEAAVAARGGQVKRLLAEVKAIRDENAPIFITGDFNEPSHLDWTAAAAEARHCPLPVDWPSTKAVMAANFLDAYRVIHPDPVKERGHTWTPISAPTNPKDRHDRIDFVFATGPQIKIKNAQVVGENAANADIVVNKYPSDHRAVVAEIELPAEDK